MCKGEKEIRKKKKLLSERIIRLGYDDLISEKNRKIVSGWLADRENEEEKNIALQDVMQEILQFNENPSDKLRERANELRSRYGIPPQKEKPAKRVRLSGRRIALRIAAVLIPILVISGITWNVLYKTDEPDAPTVSEVVISVEHETGISPIILPDGSSVTVISGQLTHLSSFENERHVKLDGHAEFLIERDTAMAFTVHTDYLEISVLGTDFRVISTADINYSTIDLLHGSIQVDVGDRSVIMLPGQHLYYDHVEKEFELSQIPIGERRYKRMPHMNFNNASLADIFYRLESEYGVPVIINGFFQPDLADKVIDLTTVTNIESLMRKLEIISNCFYYEISGTHIIVTPK